MIVDTSALIAILSGEPERRAFNELIARAKRCSMSAGTYLETAIVIEARYGYEGIRDLSFFLQVAAIELVPFDAEQAEIARIAYARYGKGRGDAGLNFGDCFAYALAKLRDEPLLFKGDDFARTDVVAAL